MLTLDHADGFDEINLPIKYALKDTDSKSIEQFDVNIVDDGTIAVSEDLIEVVEGSAQIKGNVIDAKDKGADQDLAINEYTYTNTSGKSVTSSTFGTEVETPTGKLTVNQGGSWTFTPSASIDNSDGSWTDTPQDNVPTNPNSPYDVIQDKGSFSYKLVDADGDVSAAATQPIRVTDTAPVIDSDKDVVLKEDNLYADSGVSGLDVVEVETAFTVSANKDDIADIYFTIAEGTQTGFYNSSGLPIYYRYAEVNGEIDYSTIYASTSQAGELVATTVDDPNNNVVFKVDINPDGLAYTDASALTYTATLFDTVQHYNIDSDGDGRLDNLIFNLDYAVVDNDGSVVEDHTNSKK